MRKQWSVLAMPMVALAMAFVLLAAKTPPGAGPLGAAEHWAAGDTGALTAEVAGLLERIDPADSRNVARVGGLLLKAGQAAEAERLFAKAIQLDVKDDQMLSIIALAYREAKMWDKADAMFAKATAMDPEDMDDVAEWGVAYWNRGDKAKAGELFAKALTAEPDSKRILYKIGSELR